MKEYTDTQKLILEIGKKEFLCRGFKEATIEDMIKATGLAEKDFKKCYPTKEAIFDELVSDAADGLMNQFRSSQDAHFDLIPNNRTHESRELAKRNMTAFINYVYDNFDAFKLVICCAEGSKYARYILNLVDLDVSRTEEFYAELRRTGRSEAHVSFQLHHMISRAYFTAVFETVACNMTKDQAELYIDQICRFFSCGWQGIMNG